MSRPLFGSVRGLFRLVLIALVLGVHSGTALAQTPASRALQSLFEQRFETHYEEGKCGQNILGLVEAARGLAIADAQVLLIENRGFSVFGMVNVESAREAGRAIRPQPARRPFREAGERNWYHHVILVFDGMVYDFDFTNRPTVLPVRDYLERMFLDEDPKPGYGGFYVGRDDKLKEYVFEVYSAADYLAGRTRERGVKRPLEQLLQ